VSIETEKWEATGAAVVRSRKVILRVDTPGTHAEDVSLAKKVAVLPEALALLDSWQKEHDKTCDCTRCSKTLDILRRAGVVP
jgi:hypothetical protein